MVILTGRLRGAVASLPWKTPERIPFDGDVTSSQSLVTDITTLVTQLSFPAASRYSTWILNLVEIMELFNIVSVPSHF